VASPIIEYVEKGVLDSSVGHPYFGGGGYGQEVDEGVGGEEMGRAVDGVGRLDAVGGVREFSEGEETAYRRRGEGEEEKLGWLNEKGKEVFCGKDRGGKCMTRSISWGRAVVSVWHFRLGCSTVFLGPPR